VLVLSALEVFNDTVPRSGAMNMALDEVLWQSAAAPQLRFYEWDHPAISFGYFGRYAEVAGFQSEHDLVRRCTGGGIVFHGADLTYALVVPADNLLNRPSPTAIYSFVHETIQQALVDDGIAATLAAKNSKRDLETDANPVADKATSQGSCFALPVPYDVLVDGDKVAGAAQRRSRRGLLQQGSIQNVQLSIDFRERLIAGLSETPIARRMDTALIEQAQHLADAKYGSSTWLRKR
jgi:lipoyl(octanoyl) transferase